MEDINSDPPHSVSTARSVTLPVKHIFLVGSVVLLCSLSFYGGVIYQKGHNTTKSVAARTMLGSGRSGSGFGFRARRGGFGSVTAISASSITIQDQRTGISKTYNIDSSTQITNNGSAISASSIKVGDTVLIRAGSAGPTTATSILVNPSFSSSGSTQPDSSTDNPSTNTPSQSI